MSVAKAWTGRTQSWALLQVRLTAVNTAKAVSEATANAVNRPAHVAAKSEGGSAVGQKA